MTDLSTNYMGLHIVSPLIISSSGLTNSVDKIRKFEELGAGAVVLKSLFEEQINHDAGKWVDTNASPESYDYVTNYSKAHALEEYLKLIEGARKATSIPVIASINCISGNNWMDFARNIEDAGAHALELNLFFISSERDRSSEEIEDIYKDLIVKIQSVTKLPISVKMGFHFTNPVRFIFDMYSRGVKAVVLFNRFYEPDIDIEKMEITTSNVFSAPADIRNSLRWVGIVSNRVSKIDVAASTGIHDGKAAIKQILAGAKAVQVCSVLYQNGAAQIQKMNEEIATWMSRKGYPTLDSFRGKLNMHGVDNPSLYERVQFMKYFSTYD